MLIVAQCFENQLASVQTLSQIHLKLVGKPGLWNSGPTIMSGSRKAPCTKEKPVVWPECAQTPLMHFLPRGTWTDHRRVGSLWPLSLCPTPSHPHNKIGLWVAGTGRIWVVSTEPCKIPSAHSMQIHYSMLWSVRVSFHTEKMIRHFIVHPCLGLHYYPTLSFSS